MTPFANAILKYGWENITHEILADGLTYDEACEMEIHKIQEEKTMDRRYGYNVLTGGKIPLANCPAEVREKMRKSSFAKWSRPEYIEGHTGDNHWTHKNGYSKKCVEAMTKANKGKKLSPERVEKLMEKGRHQKRFFGRENKTSKPVVCFSLDGEELARYGGMMEASRETGATFQAISLVCKRKQKTAGGFIWRLEVEVDNDHSEN